MFGGNPPIIRTLHGLQHDIEVAGKEDDVAISNEGTHLKITRTTKDVKDTFPVSVIISHSFQEHNCFYYEAEMTKSNNSIAIGLIDAIGNDAVENYLQINDPTDWNILKISRWPGFDQSYTYHGNTGKIWNDVDKLCGSPLKVNDIVGCGLDDEEIFFTLNGEKLEVVFEDVSNVAKYPIISMKGDGSEVEVNLGDKQFAYQPSTVSIKTLSKPETFCEEWVRHVNDTSQPKENIPCDHLKDVTIFSKDDHEIKCHGLILSVRSKVFQTMLEPSKNADKKINIKDFDATTINKMLLFLYSDKVDEDEIDMDLLGIANMYQLEALQVVCERRLCVQLDVNNVLDAWVGAHLFKRRKFSDICEEFIYSEFLEVQKTESFSRLMRENSEDAATLAVRMLNIQIKLNQDKIDKKYAWKMCRVCNGD